MTILAIFRFTRSMYGTSFPAAHRRRILLKVTGAAAYEHPVAVEFDFRDNRLLARYQYDEKEQEKIDIYLWAYVEWKRNGCLRRFDGLRIYRFANGTSDSK